MLEASYATFAQGQYCLPTKDEAYGFIKRLLSSLDKTTGFTKYVIELGVCWYVVLGMSFATFFISIAYIYLLKMFTKPLLYASMLTILLGFVLLGGWCWLKRSEYDPDAESKNYNYSQSGAISAWFVGFVYFILIACCWNNIKLGAAILEAASHFVTQNLRILLVPLTSFFLFVLYMAYWITTAVFLYSIGEPEY